MSGWVNKIVYLSFFISIVLNILLTFYLIDALISKTYSAASMNSEIDNSNTKSLLIGALMSEKRIEEIRPLIKKIAENNDYLVVEFSKDCIQVN